MDAGGSLHRDLGRPAQRVDHGLGVLELAHDEPAGLLARRPSRGPPAPARTGRGTGSAATSCRCRRAARRRARRSPRAPRQIRSAPASRHAMSSHTWATIGGRGVVGVQGVERGDAIGVGGRHGQPLRDVVERPAAHPADARRRRRSSAGSSRSRRARAVVPAVRHVPVERGVPRAAVPAAIARRRSRDRGRRRSPHARPGSRQGRRRGGPSAPSVTARHPARPSGPVGGTSRCHNADMGVPWPLFGLVLRSARLELRSADRRRPAVPSSRSRGRGSTTRRRCRSGSPGPTLSATPSTTGSSSSGGALGRQWSVDAWSLPFAVFLDGRPIGVQERPGRRACPTDRAVDTGSWLGMPIARPGLRDRDAGRGARLRLRPPRCRHRPVRGARRQRGLAPGLDEARLPDRTGSTRSPRAGRRSARSGSCSIAATSIASAGR